MPVLWDHATYRPRNVDEQPSPGLLVFLAGALAGALVAAPFWIGVFEWLFGGRP